MRRRLQSFPLLISANRQNKFLGVFPVAKIALGVIFLLMVTGLLVAWSSWSLDRAQMQYQALSMQADSMQRAMVEQKDRHDFTQSLPLKADSTAIGLLLTSAALNNGVELTSLTQTQDPGSTSELPSQRWLATLNGTYPSIKNTLASVQHGTSVNVLELSAQRTSESLIDARVVLVRWLAPQASGRHSFQASPH